MLAPHLIGRDPDRREEIWQDLRREIRAYDHMGHGPIDIALWDLQAKRLGTSVGTLLGAFRTRLPTYASTYHGQDEPGGLDTPQAFADYALACRERGLPASRSTAGTMATSKREAANRARCAQGRRRRLSADARPGVAAPDLARCALCRTRLR